MKTLFWNVDTQYDFMRNDDSFKGALPVEGARSIEGNLAKLTSYAREHGYQILKDIKQSTDNKVVIEEGTLYPMLKKLENWGSGELHLVQATRKIVDGRKRKHYVLSDDGLRIFNHLEGFFTAIIDSLSNLFDFQIILDDSIVYCPNCSNKILIDDVSVNFCEICGLNIESIRN